MAMATGLVTVALLDNLGVFGRGRSVDPQPATTPDSSQVSFAPEPGDAAPGDSGSTPGEDAACADRYETLERQQGIPAIAYTRQEYDDILNAIDQDCAPADFQTP